MIWLSLIKYWKPMAAITALVAIWGYHSIAVNNAFRNGRNAEREAARIEAAKRITEMEKSDAEFRHLSSRERCIAFMRDSGLPEHHCN